MKSTYQVKRGQLLWGTLRRLASAEYLIFVGVDQGEDDEERVMRMLQRCLADQL